MQKAMMPYGFLLMWLITIAYGFRQWKKSQMNKKSNGSPL